MTIEQRIRVDGTEGVAYLRELLDFMKLPDIEVPLELRQKVCQWVKDIVFVVHSDSSPTPPTIEITVSLDLPQRLVAFITTYRTRQADGTSTI